MPILDPEIRKQRRKERHERDKARALVDPEYAARRREIDKNAKKKYEMKKKKILTFSFLMGKKI